MEYEMKRNARVRKIDFTAAAKSALRALRLVRLAIRSGFDDSGINIEWMQTIPWNFLQPVKIDGKFHKKEFVRVN